MNIYALIFSLYCISSILYAQNRIHLPLWEEKGGEYLKYPLLTVYLPSSNGKIIIMCPEGGYGSLAAAHEGHDMSGWFNR